MCTALCWLQLLDEGADIHVIAPKRQYGGSALAEAIAGRHEAVVELLLRYGADPFTENPSGKTPLDLALEARAVNILRACERQALFAGYVSTRVRATGSLRGLA
jgi:ankyrin repeat protein